MKNLILLLLFGSLISAQTFAQLPYNNLDYIWSNQAGGSGRVLPNSHPQNLGARNKIVKIDNQNNVYVACSFSGSVDFNIGGTPDILVSSGGYDVAITKYDSGGNYIRTITFGGTGDDIVMDFTIVNGTDPVLVGSFQSTVDFDPGVGVFNMDANTGSSGGLDAWAAFTVSLDQNGAFNWANSIRSSTVGAYAEFSNSSIVEGASGSVFLVGKGTTSGGPADFDPSAGIVFHDYDMYWVRYDVNGNYLYSSGIVNFYDRANRETIKIENNVVYTLCTYSGPNRDLDPSGGTDLYSSPFVLGNYEPGLALIRLNELTGNYIGTETYHISEPIRSDMAIDGNGDVHIVGSYAGEYNVLGNYVAAIGLNAGYMLKTNSTGSPISIQPYNVGGTQVLNNVETIDDGLTETIYVAYYTNLVDGVYGAGTNIVKFDLNHNYIFHENFPDGGMSRFLMDLEVNESEQSLYVACHIQSNTDMDPNAGTAFHSEIVNNFVQNDLILAKYFNCRLVGESLLSNSACVGDDHVLTGIAVANQYEWTGPNGFTSTVQNPTINSVSLTDAGIYNVFNELGGCAWRKDSINLTVNPVPVLGSAVSVNDANPCEGDDITFSAPLVAGVDYSWTGPNGFTSTQQNPTIVGVDPSNSGTYVLVITDQVTGCSNLASAGDSINVNVDAAPSLGASIGVSDANPCEGDDITFSAPLVAGVDYSWTGPNGFTSTQQNPTIVGVDPSNSGTYVLVITDQVTGCSNLASAGDSVNVNVNAAPVIGTLVTASDNMPCEGDNVTLTAPLVGGVDYSWTGPNGFTSTQQNPTLTNVNNTFDGFYTLVITDQITGCSNIVSAGDSVEITVNQSPTISLGDTVVTCNVGSVVLDAGSYTSYDWSTGETTQTITVNQSGWYTVTVFTGSCASNLDSLYAEVGDDQATVDYTGPHCPGDDFLFSAQGGASYDWNGPSGFTSTDSSNIVSNVSLADVGSYDVLVTFANGCQQTLSAPLVLEDDIVCFRIPEIITPNGDGLNDNFVIEFIDNYTNNSVVILNRWGGTVFSSSPYNNDFNGTPNRGINLTDGEVPNGTYYYIIDLGDGSEAIKGALEIQK